MKNLLKVFVAIDLILINALLGFLIYKNEFKLTDKDSNIERLQEISSQNEESKD